MKKLLLFIIGLISIYQVKAQSGFCRLYVPSGNITTATPGSTISGKIFNGTNIHLSNDSNIHITHCKFLNLPSVDGVRLDNCKNVTIDSCDFDNVRNGLYAFQCRGGIQFLNNQGRNINSVPLNSYGHFCQFNACSGAGNKINYNKVDIPNPSQYVGDLYNVYKSNGTPISRIEVIGNWARGGGTGVSGLGVAGIIAGDVNGNYQVVEHNILVNTGYAGIQVQGGNYITVMYNDIYSDLLPYSEVGLNTSNTADTNIPSGIGDTITLNRINWLSGYYNCGCGPRPGRDTQYRAGTSPKTNALAFGWKSNTVWPASYMVTYNSLPAQIYDPCTAPVVTYPSPLNYMVGQSVSFGPTSTGATVSSYTAATLPAGLSINTTTGVVSGTVTTAKAATDYAIIAHGSSLNDTIKVSIQVVLNKPSITYSASVLVYTYGIAITALVPTNTGGSISHFGTSSALPAGLVIDTLTGIITGTPSAVRTPYTCTVTAYNSSGTSSFTLNFSVNKKALTITTDNKSKYIGSVNPTLTVSYSGFALSDGPSSLLNPVVISTTALTGSPLGSYPITASGASSNNYIISYSNSGKLTINPVTGNYGPIIKGLRIHYH